MKIASVFLKEIVTRQKIQTYILQFEEYWEANSNNNTNR